MTAFIVLATVLLPLAASGQDSSSLPAQTAPQQRSAPPYRTPPPGSDDQEGAYGFLYRFQAACGLGSSVSELTAKPAGMCGVGATVLPYAVTEFGVMGPQAHHSSVSGYLSEDLVIPVAPSATRSWHGHPLGIFGYTRLFETGHALDYGVGYERHIDAFHSLQFELRDYYTFANPNMHNVFLRAVWTVGVLD